MEILELIFHPFFGIIQAMVAVLWPTEDPVVLRLQWICRWTLAATVMFVIAAGYSFFLLPTQITATLTCLALLMLVISSVVGNSIESKCRRNRIFREEAEQNNRP